MHKIISYLFPSVDELLSASVSREIKLSTCKKDTFAQVYRIILVPSHYVLYVRLIVFKTFVGRNSAYYRRDGQLQCLYLKRCVSSLRIL